MAVIIRYANLAVVVVGIRFILDSITNGVFVGVSIRGQTTFYFGDNKINSHSLYGVIEVVILLFGITTIYSSFYGVDGVSIMVLMVFTIFVGRHIYVQATTTTDVVVKLGS